MPTIVTHVNPDLDAVSSCWLIQKYHPHFAGRDDITYAFVHAGKTWQNMSVDTNRDVIHVDTGKGIFDHHHIPAKLSAFLVIYQWLRQHDAIPVYDIDALALMAEVVTDYDNFAEVYYPEPLAPYQLFQFALAVDGLNHTRLSNEEKVKSTYPFLDGLLQLAKNRIKAEKNIKEGKVIHVSGFPKTIAMENTNNDCMKYAQKAGYHLVIRRDPDRGNIRIVCLPNDMYDLTPLYKKIIAHDTIGTWFLHQSKHMLLNGSTVNPSMVPSPLTLQEIIQIAESLV